MSGQVDQRVAEARRNLIAADDGRSRCDHTITTYVIRTLSDGRIAFGFQCLVCGYYRAVKASEAVNPVPYDDTISQEFFKSQRDSYERKRAAQERALEAEQAEWWRRYNEHLRSDAWKALRAKVIKRESGLCQGCREQRGTQTHHLTYARVGRELLTDLVLVCDACHELAHEGRR